jgi:hypothetical protein
MIYTCESSVVGKRNAVTMPQAISKTLAHALLLTLLAAYSAIGQRADAAEKKVVLQINDNGSEREAAALNIAQALVNRYGEDLVLEVVAFGPGLNFLAAKSVYGERIADLRGKGVRFSACRSTAKKISEMTAKPPQLLRQADYVEGGVTRILELVEQGYVLLKP